MRVVLRAALLAVLAFTVAVGCTGKTSTGTGGKDSKQKLDPPPPPPPPPGAP